MKVYLYLLFTTFLFLGGCCYEDYPDEPIRTSEIKVNSRLRYDSIWFEEANSNFSINFDDTSFSNSDSTLGFGSTVFVRGFFYDSSYSQYSIPLTFKPGRDNTSLYLKTVNGHIDTIEFSTQTSVVDLGYQEPCLIGATTWRGFYWKIDSVGLVSHTFDSLNSESKRFEFYD